MSRFILSTVLASSLLALCLGVEAEPAHHKSIAIIDASGLDPKVLVPVCEYVKGQLRVPVRVQHVKRFEAPFLRAFAKKLQVYKQPDDVCVIVLVPGGNAIKLHSTVERDLQMATVNVSALHSDDPVKMVKRLQRHVMRGVGFLFGLKPAPDPHCVTKHYRTLEDLDKMGMNYCPPSQGKFRAEALKRGMTVFTPPRPQVKRGADPLK